MIVDGKRIAEDVARELRERVRERGSRTLAAVIVGEDRVTAKFVAQKEKFAASIGVSVLCCHVSYDISYDELRDILRRMGEDERIHGVVVQLPLPAHLNTDAVLAHIPQEKDVDALAPNTPFVSPVALAVHEIFKRHGVELAGRRAAVVGQGRLVGKPVATWLVSAGATVDVVDITTESLATHTRTADILVCGAGSPHLVTPDMVKNGVVLVDAGTSEQAGKLVGDIDPTCAEKASLYTPVPGGIGPITVAMLFQNLLSIE